MLPPLDTQRFAAVKISIYNAAEALETILGCRQQEERKTTPLRLRSLFMHVPIASLRRNTPIFRSIFFSRYPLPCGAGSFNLYTYTTHKRHIVKEKEKKKRCSPLSCRRDISVVYAFDMFLLSA
ncbi:hypothetical protein MRX96_041585 [Rhipicephalus microplus]